VKIFTTWTFKGVAFLAIQTSRDSFQICDEQGNNYGAWQTLRRFRGEQCKNSLMSRPLGKTDLSFWNIREFPAETPA